MTPLAISVIAVLLFIIVMLSAKDSDKKSRLIFDERLKEIEKLTKKIITSRLEFKSLKSVNAVLDTMNDCFYDVDNDGNYIVDSEYSLSDVTDEWWEKLSVDDLNLVNRMAHKVSVKP